MKQIIESFIKGTTPWIDEVNVKAAGNRICRYDALEILKALDEFLGDRIPDRAKKHEGHLYSWWEPTGFPYGENSMLAISYFATLEFKEEKTILTIVEKQSFSD